MKKLPNKESERNDSPKQSPTPIIPIVKDESRPPPPKPEKYKETQKTEEKKVIIVKDENTKRVAPKALPKVPTVKKVFLFDEKEGDNKTKEELLKIEQEKRKIEEERKKLEEDILKKGEEERIRIEKERIQLEEEKRMIQEQKKMFEERKKQEEEEMRRKIQQEERNRLETLKQQEELQKSFEEMKRSEEERLKIEEEAQKRSRNKEKQRLENERKRLEEEKNRFEARQKEEREEQEQERKRKEEEDRIRLEEEIKRKADEERIRIEAERLQLEQEKKIIEEQRRIWQERKKVEEEMETKRTEEEERVRIEILKHQQEILKTQEEKKKLEEDRKRLEDEIKRKSEEEKMRLEFERIKWEEQKKQFEERQMEDKKKEEELKKLEVERRKIEEENKRIEMEEKKKFEQERMRIEEEKKRLEEKEKLISQKDEELKEKDTFTLEVPKESLPFINSEIFNNPKEIQKSAQLQKRLDMMTMVLNDTLSTENDIPSNISTQSNSLIKNDSHVDKEKEDLRSDKEKRYVEGDKIGRGGMGTVYMAHDIQQNKVVAMKKVSFEDGGSLNQALKEVMTVQSLKHPNLIQYKDSYISHDLTYLYLIMDLYKEGDFEHYLQKFKNQGKLLPENEVLNFMLQMTNGVGYLHEKGLIHRDLKPGNVFMSNNYQTLLIGDFGLVKDINKSIANTFAGTQKYMAPEYFEDTEDKTYGKSVDIWSLGCVFYEMCVAEYKQPLYILLYQNTEKFNQMILDELKKNYSPLICDIIISTLQRNAKDRPNANELKDMIEGKVQPKSYNTEIKSEVKKEMKLPELPVKRETLNPEKPKELEKRESFKETTEEEKKEETKSNSRSDSDIKSIGKSVTKNLKNLFQKVESTLDPKKREKSEKVDTPSTPSTLSNPSTSPSTQSLSTPSGPPKPKKIHLNVYQAPVYIVQNGVYTIYNAQPLVILNNGLLGFAQQVFHPFVYLYDPKKKIFISYILQNRNILENGVNFLFYVLIPYQPQIIQQNVQPQIIQQNQQTIIPPKVETTINQNDSQNDSVKVMPTLPNLPPLPPKSTPMTPVNLPTTPVSSSEKIEKKELSSPIPQPKKEEKTPLKPSGIILTNISNDIKLPTPEPEVQKKISTSTKQKVLPTLDKTYNGWNVNFISVFKIQEIQQTFLEYLKVEQNTEPFKFILEIEKFNDNPQEQMYHFKYLCENYVPHANVSAKEKNEVLEIYDLLKSKDSWDYEKSPQEVLEKIRGVSFNDLKFDVWPRFKSSDQGFNVISKFIGNEEVLTQNPLYSVMYKLKDSFYGEKLINEDELRAFAQDLSDAKMIRSTYLSTNWAETEKLEEKVKTSTMYMKKQDTKEEFISSKQMDLQFKKNIRVKIIIVDKSKKLKPKKLGFTNFLSPILRVFGEAELKDEEEDYQTALLIGPWIFQWDDSELCVPKKCVLNAAILSADVDEICTLNTLDNKIEKLSKAIVDWNVKMAYKSKGEDKERYGNSQDFVESILKSIGVEPKLPESLEKFLKKMRTEGSSKLELTLTPEFQKKFDIKETSIVFKSHMDIDDLVHKLYKVDPKFETNHKGEYQFLKSFDRAFWMKYFNTRAEYISLKRQILEKNSYETQKKLKLCEIELFKVQPCETCGKENCPFKDPIETNSIFI